MPVLVRNVVSAAGAAVVTLALAACSGAPEATPPGTPTAQRGSAPAQSSQPSEIDPSPVVFAFTCEADGGGSKEYTTYAAVWDSHATHCTAERISGTEPSAQQADAVAAARGTATLQQLAALCAVSGAAPWTAAVGSAAEADTARGLLAYCPGHPQRARLRAALDAYSG